ncbi:MAG: hypothetical protein JWO82_2910, partial [Akkermansiaceae bacterium]|nr:hypothetical protein [Akkermansiaceae bacterium]
MVLGFLLASRLPALRELPVGITRASKF